MGEQERNSPMKTCTGLLIAVVSALIVASAYADGTTDQAAAPAPATNGQSATMVIVAIPFLFVVAAVTVVCLFQLRRNAMLHRTLAAMIEKGVPIPPELLQPTERVKPKRSDLHRGLVACGVGIGLMLFLWIVGGGLVDGRQVSGQWGLLAANPLVLAIQVKGIWAVGFIPLFIGIGYLISWKLEQRKPNS